MSITDVYWKITTLDYLQELFRLFYHVTAFVSGYQELIMKNFAPFCCNISSFLVIPGNNCSKCNLPLKIQWEKIVTNIIDLKRMKVSGGCDVHERMHLSGMFDFIQTPKTWSADDPVKDSFVGTIRNHPKGNLFGDHVPFVKSPHNCNK